MEVLVPKLSMTSQHTKGLYYLWSPFFLSSRRNHRPSSRQTSKLMILQGIQQRCPFKKKTLDTQLQSLIPTVGQGIMSNDKMCLVLIFITKTNQVP